MQITVLVLFNISPTCCQGGSNIRQRSQTYVLHSKCAVWTAMTGIETASFIFLIYILKVNVEHFQRLSTA